MEFLLQNFDAIVKLTLGGVAALAFFFALRNDIVSLKIDINHVKENQRQLQEAFVQLNNILTKVAVQDVRLNMIDKKLDELSHGQGFVGVSK
jgi:hypothetical protein